MKAIIVTADDFGASPGVNAAVLRAYREGILRYASLLVKGEAAEEAVNLARANPGLGVGLHLELCLDSPEWWGLRYFFNPADRRRLEPAIRSQMEAFLATGLKPTHVDGHMNIHVHPVIFPILVRLAKEYGIPRLRLPGGEAAASWSYGKDGALGRLVLAGVFAGMRLWLKKQADGVDITDRTWGLLRSGTMDEDYVVWLLGRLPKGSTEIYFHPTVDPDSAVVGRRNPDHRTVTELLTLISPRVRRALRESGAALQAEPGAPGLAC